MAKPPGSLAFVLVALAAAPAVATVPLQVGLGGPRGYGTDCLSPNDDGTSASIDITPAFPAGLRFFTGTHTRVFVNTNGNITFSGAEPVYTPQAFPVASRPMIAAYWADIDLRPMTHGDCRGLAQYTGERGDGACQNPTHNGTWWKLEPGKMTISWDAVGYYSCKLDHVMDFQMVLTAADQSGCGATEGDFDVEFRFNRCEWTTGDASGGSGGFGGTAAQVGFDAGNLSDFVQIAGSMTADINTIVCNDSNVGEPGRWVFQIRGGTVVCPDSGEACDTGQEGVCGIGRTSCVGAGTECRAVVTPSDERCNALDDDCDGTIDEEAPCDNGGICDNGVCLGPCNEVTCPGIDEACVDVSCEAGFRCVEGACVDACAGVTCPVGTDCRAGRCVDSCAGFACDECSVCVDGACEARCSEGSCGAGTTCQPDGRCVSDSCVGVSCEPGFFCEGGGCADACTGAVCPEGQACTGGQCVDESAPPPTDPPDDSNGPSDPNDADDDDGVPLSPASDEDEDGGDDGSADRACACTSSDRGDAALAAPLLAVVAALLRRRR
ncbi:MAG: hypothetical protein IT383_06425 [Deltaproteobacteria bacterium]|nr:hypothetical protein [Deltaproteobacteria bacterium]